MAPRLVEGGRGAGTRENRGGRWTGSGRRRSGMRDHVRTGGGRRMRDIKFFNDFLVLFKQTQKSEPKNIDYLLF